MFKEDAYMSKELLFVRPASGLVKAIGSYTVLGTVLGPSINIWWWAFMAIIPNIYPGATFSAIYAIGAPFIIIEGISMALVMVAMPRSGSNYIMISRGINPAFGLMEAWRSILQNPIARGILCFMTGEAIGATFVILGKVFGIAGLLSMGSTIVANPWISVVFGIIMMGIGCLIDYIGPGATGKWMMFWVVFDIIALVGTIGVFALTGPVGIRGAWDRTWGAGAYDEVVSVATAGGYSPTPFSWGATLAALALPFGVTYPYTVMPWVGEVTETSKNVPLACIGGAIILAVLHSTAGISYQYAYGTFSEMYVYSLWTGLTGQFKINEVIAGRYALNLGTLGACLTPNAAFATFLCFGPIFGSLSDLLCGIAYTTRPLFAASFDRFGPEIFTRVSRYGSMPYNLAFCWLYSIPWIILCGYGWLFTEVFSLMIAYYYIRAIIAYVGISLPWTRPHIFESAAPIARKSVGPIPVMTIAGLLMFAWCFYLMYTSAAVDPMSIIITLILAFIVGNIVYIAYSAYNKKRGIDTSKIFAELPPG